ncbi:alpha amylase catalytic region [Leptothrix cholodnii SP-6]|uniref:Alpha amylase catalytic region n=1 Tax=Leptothrix cholodnii (strain ATCC 51168 / LMG 8142 / SP-6) TaxID=395495 RepID=B1Y2D1_LEPCP|nr:alpha-glucosidase family protein [Leptothrix cholodnii]ACB35584.1 alpha amylase catalytic region [Leptothrix cholodnii SP-6]
MKAPNNGWWRGGVIYQIYPRSYQDSNGDGIGDLPGITRRLDHIAALGADGIWLSPFFKSPMKDFGYDISDYNDVDPMFGTLADFKVLVDRAHALGLKVMIDQVYSHTADVHPWFVESRSSRTNDKADWYVWADPLDDGNPPNNWLSIFGGSAWQWDTRRRQYYLHNFLTSQPDLNFHCPQVQEAVLASVKFWCEFGVDGYRLDVVNFYFHDRQLRNNPGRGMPDGSDPAVSPVNPYAWQWHHHDKSQPENLPFLQRLRALIDEYPDTTMVGEIGDDDGLARVAEYTGGGDKLHMAYCFDLLGEPHGAPYLHGVFTRFNQVVGSGWPCWAITNHDIPRVATRWGGANPSMGLLRAAVALQLSLRGTACIYQGDELGLPEADVAFEDLQDPYGITMWPEYKGRDGCRTPMAWDSKAADLGFGGAAVNARPWLPVAQSHRALAVDVQGADPQSLLSHYQQLLRWRRGVPALIHGEMTLLSVHPQVLAYLRSHQGERVLCAFNLSDQPVTWDATTAGVVSAVLGDSGAQGAALQGSQVRFDPWGVLFARLV